MSPYACEYSTKSSYIRRAYCGDVIFIPRRVSQDLDSNSKCDLAFLAFMCLKSKFILCCLPTISNSPTHHNTVELLACQYQISINHIHGNMTIHLYSQNTICFGIGSECLNIVVSVLLKTFQLMQTHFRAYNLIFACRFCHLEFLLPNFGPTTFFAANFKIKPGVNSVVLQNTRFC